MKERIILIALLVVSGIFHAYNMFHYPYFENDEGTYLSYAWSFAESGAMSPYTYWYDHAPAGWILMALWLKATGGLFTFGPSVNSGRVLMLVVHLVTVALLFVVSRRLTRSLVPGTIAVLIFSISPLGVYFQRRVLLDNLMIFWTLLSMWFLTTEPSKLSRVAASSVAFGIAILTKENAVFFLPAFLYMVVSNTQAGHRRFALSSWVGILILTLMIYPLYALLKGELFPPGWFGNNTPHVSLIGTLEEQLSRGRNLPFWNSQSEFYVNLIEWLRRDAWTVITGGLATVIGILLSVRVKILRIPTFMSALFWIFLLRGKLVIDFYVVPLIPLLALNVGTLVYLGARAVSFGKPVLQAAAVTLFGTAILAPLVVYADRDFLIRDEVTPQLHAIEWVKKNVPPNRQLVIDNGIFLDLRYSRFTGDPSFPNADFVWKVEADPAIRVGKLGEDWRRIDYITVSHEILKQVREKRFPFVKKALDNSEQKTLWAETSISYIDVPKYLSTNGDWMAIYEVKDDAEIALDSAWEYYKSEFIHSYGQVINPQANVTTSEGQSYAMLRSVWMNDRTTFDGVWQWTRDHLQHRTSDKLLSWLWKMDSGEGNLGDPESATDADIDTALALVFAYKTWNEPSYLDEARAIIEDIWNEEVIRTGNRYTLAAGSNYKTKPTVLVNPSYYSPAAFRIFSAVDLSHPWDDLVTDGYALLTKLSGSKEDPRLPPNWVIVHKDSGVVQAAGGALGNPEADLYGFDAFRTMFRIALDAKWYDAEDAKSYLALILPIYRKEWQTNKSIAALYNTNGARKVQYGSLATTAAPITVMSVLRDKSAEAAFNGLLARKFNMEKGFWEDGTNYYDQNWAWFATGFISHRLTNLWQ